MNLQDLIHFWLTLAPKNRLDRPVIPIFLDSDENAYFVSENTPLPVSISGGSGGGDASAANQQAQIESVGLKTDAMALNNTGTFSLIALVKRISDFVENSYYQITSLGGIVGTIRQYLQPQAAYCNVAATGKISLSSIPSRLHFINATNDTANPCWIQLFNVLYQNVTLGTTPPKQTYYVPVNGAITLNLNIDFDNCVVVAVTTTKNGATPATVVLNMNYNLL